MTKVHPSPRSSPSLDGDAGRRAGRKASLVAFGAFLLLAHVAFVRGCFSAYWSQSAELARLRAKVDTLATRTTSREEESPWPFVIPVGQPPNLPRIETTKKEEEASRGIYGGRGDGKHLGGFTNFDPDGVSPNVWANMLRVFGVKSMMDVGCGRGISTRWFLEHHARVLCVEGSHDAVQQSFVPPEVIVEHDYARGPWWPQQTYDAAWSVEFLEHVSRQHMRNYMQTLRKSALIFASSSLWGGWHHMEVHSDDWWIRKFEAYGFRYDDRLTHLVRQWAATEHIGNYTLPTGDKPYPHHVVNTMKVFLNPAVLSLPAHDHLFAEAGCIGADLPKDQRREGPIDFAPRRCGTGRDGGGDTMLPDSYEPLPVDMSMHERWVEAILAGINLPEK